MRITLSFVLAVGLLAACGSSPPPPAPPAPSDPAANPPMPTPDPAANASCDRPGRNYTSRSLDECSRIRFMCVEGLVPFSDECGCGCGPNEAATPTDGVACGRARCASGQVCCNASCGICTPPDGMCTQQMCD